MPVQRVKEDRKWYWWLMKVHGMSFLVPVWLLSHPKEQQVLCYKRICAPGDFKWNVALSSFQQYKYYILQQDQHSILLNLF